MNWKRKKYSEQQQKKEQTLIEKKRVRGGREILYGEDSKNNEKIAYS